MELYFWNDKLEETANVECNDEFVEVCIAVFARHDWQRIDDEEFEEKTKSRKD